MRPTPMLLALLLSQLSVAVVPHPFVSGSPAKASDVNDNFNYLDSTVQKKASQSTVDVLSSAINAKADGSLKDSVASLRAAVGAKADGSLRDSLKARVDTGSFSTLKANVASLNATITNMPTTASLRGIRDTLGSKVDTSALRQLRDSVRTKVDANWVNSTITGKLPTGTLLASYNLKDLANTDTARKNLGLGTLATKSTVSSADVSGTLSWSQISKTGATAADVGAISSPSADGRYLIKTGDTLKGALTVTSMVSAGGFQTGGNVSSVGLKADTIAAKSITVGGNAVWHAGNLNPLVNGGSRGTNAFTDLNPPVGSWQVDPGGQTTPSGPNGSYNFQVFSTGNAGRGMQVAGAYDFDNFFARRGRDNVWQPWVALWHSGNFDPTKYVLASGGTITGDLRISGKLTTNPGTTPADYVFEPDYKLSSLSEVETYTKANKHLPEVPSASEMTEKGVNLAQMNMVLLKKVEELTLHAIEQEKSVAELKASMEARLEAQQRTIDELRTAGAKQ